MGKIVLVLFMIMHFSPLRFIAFHRNERSFSHMYISFLRLDVYFYIHLGRRFLSL